MQDPEIHRELLRETLEPAQALRLAINMEPGQRNQLQITNSQPSSHVQRGTFSTILSTTKSTANYFQLHSSIKSTMQKLWLNLVSKPQGQMYCKGQDLQ